MLKIGEKQELIIIKQVDFGVYLAEKQGSDDKVLLPGKQVPEGAKLGDKLTVFLYKDSDDRLIATTKTPKLMLGDVNMLTVTDVGKIGAFMDWGLEKDVLLPFREQTRKVKKGESVLCALYVDKSGRLAVTMNVYEFLRSDSPHHKEDRVRGTVYETSSHFPVFVAVDDIFSALIPKKELYGDIKIGDEITARVVDVREDGKLTLSVREKAYLQIDGDSQIILERMEKNGGKLPFTDKADPQLIRDEMAMSKNEFKRAIGHLLKEGKIEIGENEIRLI